MSCGFNPYLTPYEVQGFTPSLIHVYGHNVPIVNQGVENRKIMPRKLYSS